MKSAGDKIRALVRGEIHKVRPLYLAGVEAASTYASYEEDFFAASIRKMQNYQDAHRRVFCKACVSQGPKDRLSYRRLAIELVPDLLGNDTMQVRSQCSRCDFDMYIVATPVLIAVEHHCEREWNRLRSAVFEASDTGCPLGRITDSIRRAVREHHNQMSRQDMIHKHGMSQQGAMSVKAQQMGMIAKAETLRGLMDTQIQSALVGGGAWKHLDTLGPPPPALSSARTVKAKKGKLK